MAYSGLFSGFAALLALFSVAGLVLANNRDLLRIIVDALSSSFPGLIGEGGVVSTESLLNIETISSLTLASIIALLSTLWTALNFLNGARLSIRAMFDLPTKINRGFVKMKLFDLAMLLVFFVGILISAVLTAASSGITEWLLNDLFALGLSGLTSVLIRVVTVLIALVFDSLVVAAMIRVLSEVRVPGRSLRQGAIIGGVAITLLKQLSSLLLGGAASNPLLATFTALIGVLVFMNFLCLIILISSSWVKVTMDDVGQAPRLLTADEAAQIAQGSELKAQRERLAAERIRVSEELATTPRSGRRKLRREYEAIVDAQAELERRALERRLGYDLAEAHAKQNGLNPSDVTIRRD